MYNLKPLSIEDVFIPNNFSKTFMNVELTSNNSMAKRNMFTHVEEISSILFFDKPDSYEAVLNVAGYEKSEIKILEHLVLNKPGHIKVVCENKELGRIERNFSFPSDYDSASIKSSLKNGLLKISSSPVKPLKAETKSITIE